MDPGAAQNDEPARRTASFAVRLCWVAFILLLYALSTGPAYKLTINRFEARKIILGLYKPLFLFIDHIRPIDNFFDWYIYELWQGGQPMKELPNISISIHL